MTTFQDMQDRAQQVRNEYTDRNQMYDVMESYVLLEPTSSMPEGTHIKKTLDPSPRNMHLGAARLLASADPKWRVPYESNSEIARRASSKVEKFATKTYTSACRVMRRPIHYDAAYAGLLYGQNDILVKSVNDISTAYKGKGTRKQRLDAITKSTPLLFEVLSSYDCYPTYDPIFGLVFHYRRSEVYASEIANAYGDQAIGTLDRTKKVYLCDVWDEELHAVYIEGENEPIIFEAHNLEEIPISSMIVEGSPLFNKVGQQTRQPFLYALWKSGMWERLNLGLTAAWTNVFVMASNAQFLYKSAGDSEPVTNYDTIGGVTTIRNNEDYGPLMRNPIDGALLEMIDRARADVEASTIYKQTLGESLGSNAVYSTTALLAQAGRLPLTMYQKMTSYALGDAMSIGLRMIRNQGGKFKIEGEDFNVKQDIPEDFNLTCTLDIDLPQDKRVNLEIARVATEGDEPLASKRWARETLIGIDQSDMMDEEIWDEKMAYLTASVEYRNEAQNLMQQQTLPPPGEEMPLDQSQPPMQGPPQGAETMAPPQDMTGMSGTPVGNGMTAMPMEQPIPMQEGMV